MKRVHLVVGLSIGLALGTTSSVWAGEKLYLRSGVVNPKAMTAGFSTIVGANGLREFVVQFKAIPTESDKAALISRGIRIHKYLPDDAYLVQGTNAAVATVKHLAQVNAVVPYTALMKMSPDFGAFSVFTAQKLENVLIKTLKGIDTKEVAKSLTMVAPQAAIMTVEGNSIVANIPQESILAVAGLAGIEHVQPYVKIKLWNDFELMEGSAPTAPTGPGDYSDISGVEDGTRIMNFETAYAAGLTGQEQMVAMADTGLDTGDINTIHPDLRGAVYKGYTYGMFSRTWDDPMGHGTHVAGSIVGRGTSSNGRIHGGAVTSMLIAQGMWSPTLENLTVPQQLSTLFVDAYKDGARVHSNSWGAARNFGAYDAYASQVDEFVWEHPDFLPAFAAGNSGVDKNKDGRIDTGSMSSPGTAKNCLTVGASENVTDHGGIQAQIKKLRAAADAWPAEPIQSDYLSNNANGMAMFSSRGPTLDGRTKPDVVAPGTNILSLLSSMEGASDLWGAYNKFYAYSGGTSMATPLAAGAALVARQKLQVMGQQNPSAALIKGMLMHTAVDMFPGQFGQSGEAAGQELLTPRPNSDEGYGRVDLARVTQLPLRVIDDVEGVAQGQEMTYQIEVTDQPAKFWVTLVYSDAPAAASAAKTLVNDLDLVVRTPQGQEVALQDTVNNAEMVELTAPVVGSYTVVIKGTRVPQGKNGKQPFALLISASN
jgi:subtilisin family serine protease